MLSTFAPKARSIECKLFDRKNYIDQGEFFERIYCPKCREEIEMGWWQSAMDAAYEDQFIQLDIETPCCQTDSSLNDFDYDWSVGFSKFVLEISEPNLDSLDENQVEQLESVIECSLQQIWVRY